VQAKVRGGSPGGRSKTKRVGFVKEVGFKPGVKEVVLIALEQKLCHTLACCVILRNVAACCGDARHPVRTQLNPFTARPEKYIIRSQCMDNSQYRRQHCITYHGYKYSLPSVAGFIRQSGDYYLFPPPEISDGQDSERVKVAFSLRPFTARNVTSTAVERVRTRGTISKI